MTQQTFTRLIPLEELRSHKHYPDLADLAEIFAHEVIEDVGGIWRWRANPLIRRLQEGCTADLNVLTYEQRRGNYSGEQWMKFYMQIDYSLSGFCEHFSDEAADWSLPGALPAADYDAEYPAETIIDYMRRVHAGKVLKL